MQDKWHFYILKGGCKHTLLKTHSNPHPHAGACVAPDSGTSSSGPVRVKVATLRALLGGEPGRGPLGEVLGLPKPRNESQSPLATSCPSGSVQGHPGTALHTEPGPAQSSRPWALFHQAVGGRSPDGLRGSRLLFPSFCFAVNRLKRLPGLSCPSQEQSSHPLLSPLWKPPAQAWRTPSLPVRAVGRGGSGSVLRARLWGCADSWDPWWA